MLMRFNTKGTQLKDRSRATNPAAQHLLVPPPQTRAARSHPRLLELGAPPAALRAGGVQGEGQGQHRAHCHEPQGGHWGFIFWALWSQTSGCRGVEASSSTPQHLLPEIIFSSIALDSERTKPAGQKASLPRGLSSQVCPPAQLL